LWAWQIWTKLSDEGCKLGSEVDLQPYRFEDPRQQRIYEDLNELVGPGPAAFFRDACWLMQNPYTLQSTSHLVGHLVRETEGAVREVLKPIIYEKAEKEEETGQKGEIRAILAALAIPEGSPEARAWLALAGILPGVAHRKALEAPRPPDEVRELWENFQLVLVGLLPAMRNRFLDWFGILDELIEKPQPTKADIKRLKNEVPNNAVVRRYFFDNLEKPEWLKPLWKKGFFKHPPPPVRNEEEGTIQFPPWPEARYLARMSEYMPELVVEIIQEMADTDNAAAISDLVDALLAVPPELAARLAERASRWAEVPYLLLPEKLGELISHLAKGGRSDEALDIARILLDVLPDPEPQIEAGSYRLPPEPRTRIDTLAYEQILKEHYPDLVRESGLSALELLCDLLERAIELSRQGGVDAKPNDFSEIWRPTIEDSPQNHGHTIKDPLVSGVRDAADLLVRSKQATVEEVVGTLERRSWNIFRRIALHIIRVFPSQGGALAATRLTDRSLAEDVGLRHEYVLLLRDRFPHLTAEEQNKVFGWIEEGPDIERWGRERWAGQKPDEEEASRYREHWQRDWLARIGANNLRGKWAEKYRGLSDRHGEPEHPEFSVHMEVGWVGPTSPRTADELKAMPIEEIMEFLKTWEPPHNAFREPSPEGLGRELSSVVAEDPSRFAAEAPEFQELDPTYVRAVLSGLREALQKNRTFDWEPVLDLCDWVLSQPREIPGRKVREMDADPDWGWTRGAIVDLLSEGFGDHPGSIPIVLREKVWAILKPLTSDPDPTPEREKSSNMDPATLALNSVRGRAMHAVVHYALWVRRHLEKELEATGPLQGGFAELPEVREVLEAHLNPAREPSLAVRAVFGQWFLWLVLLDPNWARKHSETIFPLDRQNQRLLEAAWNAYVVFAGAYNNVWDILRPQYEYAVEHIGGCCDDTLRFENPDEKLAEHLMVFYWSGKLDLDDPLLVAFWQRASDDLRAHALSFIGRALARTESDVLAETLNRLKQLWERRLAVARNEGSSSGFTKEMAAFGWWFVSGKFDVDWAIQQLLASLELAKESNPDHMVLEQLAETAQTYPRESVQCLRIIVERDRKRWTLYGKRDSVRDILELGLQDAGAADEAEQTIHHLGSRGFLDFRDLLGRRSSG